MSPVELGVTATPFEVTKHCGAGAEADALTESYTTLPELSYPMTGITPSGRWLGSDESICRATKNPFCTAAVTIEPPGICTTTSVMFGAARPIDCSSQPLIDALLGKPPTDESTSTGHVSKFAGGFPVGGAALPHPSA